MDSFEDSIKVGPLRDANVYVRSERKLGIRCGAHEGETRFETNPESKQILPFKSCRSELCSFRFLISDWLWDVGMHECRDVGMMLGCWD
jgi:hypothetical protein